MLTRKQSTWHSHTLLVELQNDIATLKSIFIVSQEVKYTLILWPSNTTSKYLSYRNENRGSYRNVLMNVYNSVIHTILKLETAQTSCSGRERIKNKMIHPCNGIILSIFFVGIHNNVGECIMFSEISQYQKIIHCKIPCIWHSGEEKTSERERENRSVVDRGYGLMKVWLLRGSTRKPWSWENCSVLLWMRSHVSAFVNIRRIVHQKKWIIHDVH